MREMRGKARRIKSASGLGLILVDYLQLMEIRDKKTDGRQNEVSAISRGLKALAREFKVPVIALSQLSRKVEERTDKRPILSDLRESGSIEQDADVVMFLYRDEYYNRESECQGQLEIGIAKQRNGPLGIVKAFFDATCGRFADLADDRRES